MLWFLFRLHTKIDSVNLIAILEIKAITISSPPSATDSGITSGDAPSHIPNPTASTNALLDRAEGLEIALKVYKYRDHLDVDKIRNNRQIQDLERKATHLAAWDANDTKDYTMPGGRWLNRASTEITPWF